MDANTEVKKVREVSVVKIPKKTDKELVTSV
jgi:hypothetical protein